MSLGKNLKARGNVEKWLSEVESHMVHSLKRFAKTGYVSYAEEDRQTWILEQPAQLVLAVSQIYWCNDVEEKLKSSVSNLRLQDLYMVMGTCFCSFCQISDLSPTNGALPSVTGQCEAAR